MTRFLAIALLLFAGLCAGADASVLPEGARFGGSTVTVTVDATGLSMDIQTAVQSTTGQVATNTWKSKGKTVTVTTPRYEFKTHQESNDNWAKRHKEAVDAFVKLFPPDPASLVVGGGGDAIGSIPLIAPPAANVTGEVTIEWRSGLHDVRVKATPKIHETAAAFAFRVGAAVDKLEEKFPPN